MAFPTTRSALAGTQGSNANPWTLTYPGSGDILDGGGSAIVAGDLILINIGRDGATGTGSITNYTSLFDAAAASSAARGLTFAKVATGSESGTFSYTVGASEQGAWRIAVIKDWYGTVSGGVEAGGSATGTSTGPDPANFDPPSWGTVDTYWRAVCAYDDGRPAATTFPTNYSILQNADNSNGSGGAGLGSAGRQNAVSAENPSAFALTGTGNNTEWVAWVVAVRPQANITVTPTTKALTTTRFAPTVSAPRLVTPAKLSLTVTAFAPTILRAITVTPGKLSLAITSFAPTVTVTANLTVTPTTKALSTAAFAPTVTASDHKLVTPATAALIASGLAPSVATPRLSTPTSLGLALGGFAPTVTASAHQTVTPDTAALVTDLLEPTIRLSVSAVPATAELVLATFAPLAELSDHQLVTPGAASLLTSGFAPTVTLGGDQLVTPTLVTLVVQTHAPAVLIPTLTAGGGRRRRRVIEPEQEPPVPDLTDEMVVLLM